MNCKRKWIQYLCTLSLVLATAFAIGHVTTPPVSAASKASYTISNKSKKAQYQNISAKYLYQLPQLKGNSSAIKKINKSLRADYKKSLIDKKNLFETFESYKNSSVYRKYAVDLFSTTECEVTYNRNGYVCFKFTCGWYAGGVYNGWEYGMTYRLKDGKKMGIQDVLAGNRNTAKKRIAKAYSKKVSSAGYAPIMRMDYSDFQFYIKPNKKVVVSFGPYQPMGGNGMASVTMKGKIK